MTTQEVADKLVSLCREGKYDEAYGLYSKDAVSLEMPGVPNEKTEGLDNILKGFEQWASNIEETHGGTVGDPVVMGNHFSVPMSSDVTFKGMGRCKMEELCVYEVENGKIKKAQFFYDPSTMS
ncbi:nuclear transport factor 2 family protein [Flagellimonas sp. HMM57]|uniref:nuclear transport factor 2 family protein n=1 Tax=unclassified Flagellimonas TaxID=2644544 RepID=UPI0013D71956|nr:MULTISPECIES: nuclear transport factor 2 family protein [unclassified Flagellimonas]UII77568.1 nuclear transport factor 2 family protein [Flagellimonas sp. HMM57]